jgi:hypothetical protein
MVGRTSIVVGLLALALPPTAPAAGSDALRLAKRYRRS